MSESFTSLMENPHIKEQGNLNMDVPIGMDADDHGLRAINPQRNRFPYCVVWTPIPVLT